MIQAPWHRGVAACAGLLLSLLSACGGGGGGETGAGTTPVTLGLTNDANTLAWNAPATLDVLANDKASRGTISLVSVAQPAHGSVEISSGKLLYTPVAGYFGTEIITYTARADDGGVTETANVALTVEAQVVVKGTASDAPLPGAAITLQAGGRTVTVVANATGQYEAAVRSANGDAFVRIDAVGSGAQSGVRLRSLVGDVSTLLASATGGQITSTTLGRLDVSHHSTAAAALAMQANGGVEPASTAQLEEALARVKPGDLLDMAALVKRVVDGGVALPAEFADVVALVNAPAAYRSFLDATVAADPAAFAAARLATVAGLPVAAPASAGALADQTMVYFGTSEFAEAAYVVTFNSNGTAFVRGGFGAVVGDWTRDNRGIVISFQPKVVFRTLSDDRDPVTSSPNEISVNLSQLIIRSLAFAPKTVSLVQVATFTYLDGSRAGQTGTLADAGTVMKAANLEERLPVSPAEFAEGRRWSGFAKQFLTGSLAPGGFDLLQDAVMIGASGRVTSLTDPASVYRLSVGDRKLSITDLGNGFEMIPVEYMRMSVDATTGEERWLALNALVAGPVAYNGVPASIRVVAVDASVVLSDVARRWQEFRDATGSRILALFADGTGATLTSTAGRAPSSVSTTWRIDTTRSSIPQVEIKSGVSASTLTRHWLPLLQRGGALWVLETAETLGASPGAAPYELWSRTHRFEDLGPAQK
jgi:hypothetical protein